MKPKICWVSATYFLSVDLPIVPALQKDFDIDWFIISNKSNLTEDQLSIENRGCNHYELLVWQNNFIHPKTFSFYKDLLNRLANGKYDMYYLDISGMPYFFPLAKILLPSEKCVVAAHNVKTPKGARYYWMAKPYMEFIIRAFKNFQTFSKNQFDLLTGMRKNANILYAPLCLGDYGKPTITKPAGPVTFLFFGNIVEYKRIDLLIKAAKILLAEGYKDFKVKICGYCPSSKWAAIYQPMLHGVEVIDADIRRIPNEEIPNLFEESHYFVMPYQDIAQSGAITVAFYYNLPVIVSNLDSFKEYISDKENGYFFEVGSAELLALTMKYAIDHHKENYIRLRVNQMRMLEEKLSVTAVLKKYKRYIDCLCQN